MNAFADLTFEEFKTLHFTGYRKRQRYRSGDQEVDDNTDWSLLNVDASSLPNFVDWRDRGCVTDVLNQRKW